MTLRILDDELLVRRPLRRSRRHRMVAGVCGGLAEWMGWDVTVVRALFLLLAVLSHLGPALLAYAVLWIVIPEAPRRPYRIAEPWEDPDLL